MIKNILTGVLAFTLATSAASRTVGTTQSVTNASANYALSGLGVIANTIRLANTGTVHGSKDGKIQTAPNRYRAIP